jgi:hypothetical protein
MILTPIDSDRLPAMLDRFTASLDGPARALFRRIAVSGAERAHDPQAATHHGDACTILGSLGMALKPGPPQADFSWNGEAARRDTEA